MIEFRVEWLDAPGVRDPVLARSWARLEIRIEDNPIQFLDTRAGSVRSGVYGSVFPLTTWIIENWWHLIHESMPSAHALEGARSMLEQDGEKYRSWIRRHNLLAAREGNAFPDMTIFRDGNRISIVTVPDPEDAHNPGRFITKRLFDVSPADAHSGMTRLVETVLGRLSDLESDEVDQVQDNWSAILDSEVNEPGLCRALAALGEDPYDPDGIDEALMTFIQDKVIALAEPIRQDLLESASRRSLESDCTYVAALLGALHGLQMPREGVSGPFATEHRNGLPHQVGYRRARELRQQLDLRPHQPVPDLPDLRTMLISVGVVAHHVTLDIEAPGTRINGLVGASDHGLHVLVSNQRRSSSQRFLFARALHQWRHATSGGWPRLLTHAHSWEQRASRAFAAEFLAPANALRERLAEKPDVELQALANEFLVSPEVIARQIENHGLD